MNQLSLLEPNPPAWSWDDEPPSGVDLRRDQADSYGLRYYQRDAVAACFDAWTREDSPDRSVLVVMATGLGKTQVFGAIAGMWDRSVTGSDRVLVLAHRTELVEQARARIEAMTGEFVEIEQADAKASSRARLVVASVDTIKQPKRLSRFAPDHFGLVVADEAHHYLAKTFRRPLDHFKGAKILGVTATPDRGDAKALGAMFDSVAYVHDLPNGIDAGYLVPLRGRQCTLEGFDLDKIGVAAGDLVAGQLDEALVAHVAGVVEKTLELEPGKQALAFFPGVKTAELAAERFNALLPGSAAFVSGATPDDERRSIVRAFRDQRIRYLCNCQVATEGFDAPTCSVVVVARPTKSRALYAQMVGRGTRVLPGVVDGLDGAENAAARQALIGASAKPHATILDFVGVGSKHSLVGPVDLLGGEYSEAEVARAKKLAKERPEGGDAQEFLRKARAELQALAARIKPGVAKGRAVDFDPFAAVGLDLDDEARYDSFASPARPWQLELLGRKGVESDMLRGLTKRAAQKLISTVNQRQAEGLCTLKQLKQLMKRGVTENRIPFEVARDALDYLARNRWGRGPGYSPSELNRIVEDGCRNT